MPGQDADTQGGHRCPLSLLSTGTSEGMTGCELHTYYMPAVHQARGFCLCIKRINKRVRYGPWPQGDGQLLDGEGWLVVLCRWLKSDISQQWMGSRSEHPPRALGVAATSSGFRSSPGAQVHGADVCSLLTPGTKAGWHMRC